MGAYPTGAPTTYPQAVPGVYPQAGYQPPAQAGYPGYQPPPQNAGYQMNPNTEYKPASGKKKSLPNNRSLSD